MQNHLNKKALICQEVANVLAGGVAYGFIRSRDFADNIKSLGLGFVGSLAASGDGFGKGWEFPRK